MRKKSAFVISLVLISCKTVQVQDPTPPEMPWRSLEESCIPEGDHIICKRAGFEDGVMGCLNLGRQWSEMKIDLDHKTALMSVDLNYCGTQLRESRNKLNDPWRSPVTWFLIGCILGGTITAIVK